MTHLDTVFTALASVTADECVEWPGKKNHNGYGRTKNEMAHRVVYRHTVGPIPDGMQLDHLCRNRPCVRPEHLEVVTPRQNVRRAYGGETACKRGHLRTPENLYPMPKNQGYRCRPCQRIAVAKYRARKAF